MGHNSKDAIEAYLAAVSLGRAPEPLLKLKASLGTLVGSRDRIRDAVSKGATTPEQAARATAAVAALDERIAACRSAISEIEIANAAITKVSAEVAEIRRGTAEANAAIHFKGVLKLVPANDRMKN